MISDNVYDSDDAANRSPGLKPSIVRYGPDESIPPFMAERQREMSAQGKRNSSRSSSISSCDGTSSKRRRSRRVKASLADAVLMHNMAPDRPDIAREIGERTPPAESESEGEDRTLTAYIHIKPNSNQLGTGTDTNRILPADPRKIAPALPSVKELLSLNSSRPSTQDSLPYQSESRRRPRQDSLATSSVGKYTIPPPREFPAMQAPTPSTANSPEDSQRLPSIMSALAKLDGEREIGPFSAPTPSQLSTAPSNLSTMSMGSNLDSLFTPSQTLTPFTQGSPMNLQELSNTSPISYPVPHPSLTPDTSNMTAYGDTPAMGVASVRSPTKSYPTPQEARPALLEGFSDGSLAANIHKCTYPGCTAPAFQTQYLLNSHANVHSSDRPHFCPVPDCPRGVGGKGFKRKNEMIRHGLVHNSPGYVCPFCTDQQHKYPRPDNLQRHVRVHHQDKKMDDPLLRDVLAQRPKGSGRGRRRRGHS